MINRLQCADLLHDAARLSERLAEAGLSEKTAQAKAAALARILKRLKDDDLSGPRDSIAAFLVPGRIEVLGKHTDYAGGRSIVAATEQGFCTAVAARNDGQVRVIDAARDESVSFELAPELTPSIGHWSNYPLTVARRVARNFPRARRGATIVFESDLPAAAGMSSSSALMVTVFLALAAVNQLMEEEAFQANIHERTDLAGYLGTIENGQTFGTLEGDRGVGTFGGSEDHTAMLCSLPGQLVQYAYCPVRFEQAIAVPPGYLFAVGVSGVAAEKTGAAMEKYNAASRLAARLVALWQKATGFNDPHLGAILARGDEACARLHDIVVNEPLDPDVTEALRYRLFHFWQENEKIIPWVAKALTQQKFNVVENWVYASQRGAEGFLGNQIAETSYLSRSALQFGAMAASAFGAGFGGSVWALVSAEKLDKLLRNWRDAYVSRFPQRWALSRFFATRAGPAAMQIV